MSAGSESSIPVFKREMVDVTIPVGTSTKFLVELVPSGCENKVSWFHNNSPVRNSDRHVLLDDRNIYCIQIHEATPIDEGTWTCEASNKNGKASCQAKLKLHIPPNYKAPEFLTGLHGCLWDNGTLSLECDVMGVPTPVLRWYRDGKPLSAGSCLTIRSYSKESKSFMGLFACEAENCMGTKTVFSRVYARNFARYLQDVGYIKKKWMQNKKELAQPEKPAVKSGESESKKKEVKNGGVKRKGNSSSSSKSAKPDDEDSGIDHA